jgi:hypothetical protein
MEISRLIDVAPRDAWRDEARNFTPWLAEHLDQLGDVLGIQLEKEGTEVSVQDFSADILARNLRDNSFVLIENQLETTDHRHLGQILTYLAGLGAKTVIWIATGFRDEHLSAIKWLNENTAEDFNFFAICLRVVRIGDSPVAPIFDVLIRPNLWERQLQAAARSSQESSEVTAFRREFWTAYRARFPGAGVEIGGTSSVWLPVDPNGIINVSLWVGKTRVGIFVRGARGSDGSEVADLLAPIREDLEEKLGAKYVRTTGASYLFSSTMTVDMTDHTKWQAAIDWMHETATNYLNTLRQALPELAASEEQSR